MIKYIATYEIFLREGGRLMYKGILAVLLLAASIFGSLLGWDGLAAADEHTHGLGQNRWRVYQ